MAWASRPCSVETLDVIVSSPPRHAEGMEEGVRELTGFPGSAIPAGILEAYLSQEFTLIRVFRLRKKKGICRWGGVMRREIVCHGSGLMLTAHFA